MEPGTSIKYQDLGVSPKRFKRLLNFIGQRGSTDTTMSSLHDLPEDVLVKVLSHVSGNDLIHHCRLVCSLWKDVIDLPTLWKRKCELEQFFIKGDIQKPENWQRFYFLFNKKKNLIQNPCAEEELTYWHLDDNSMGDWLIEKLPGDDEQPFPQPHVKEYFVTSNGEAYKSQIIDLKTAGYLEKLMDEVQPDIVVTDWFASHESGCWYELCVQLLSADYIVLKEFHPERIIIYEWSEPKWKKIYHTFRSYGPGVRYIHFQHGGCDIDPWEVSYGVRVTNSSLVIQPPGAVGQ